MSPRIEAALVGGGLALTGALLVFIFTVIYTEIREARQRVRECAGLARLLAHEVARNEDQNTVKTRRENVPGGEEQEVLMVWGASPTVVDVWIEARTRLAQLMDREDFNVVADYYRTLQTLAEKIEPRRTEERAQEAIAVPGHEPSWEERTEQVKELLNQYSEPGKRQRWIGL